MKKKLAKKTAAYWRKRIKQLNRDQAEPAALPDDDQPRRKKK